MDMKKVSFYILLAVGLGFSACGGNQNQNRMDDPVEDDMYDQRIDSIDTARIDTMPLITPMPTVPMD
jgi:hypothetical protein